MNNKKIVPILVVIIILLSICAALSIGYIIGSSSVNKEESNGSLPISNMELPNKELSNEKIEKLKSEFNSEIAKKTAIYKDLETEKSKVQELVSELKKTKENEELLLKYKEQYKNLESKMRILINEIQALKSKKTRVIPRKPPVKPATIKFNEVVDNAKQTINLKPISKSVVVEEKPQEKPQIIQKESKKEILESSVVEAKVNNLVANGYKLKSDSKTIVTDVASKVDFVKIGFKVDVNSTKKALDKKYYIQVINSKNNVMGDRVTEYLDGKTLTYSKLKVLKLENQTSQVEYDLYSDKFEKGIYYVYIYDRSKMVIQTSFTLK